MMKKTFSWPSISSLLTKRSSNPVEQGADASKDEPATTKRKPTTQLSFLSRQKKAFEYVFETPVRLNPFKKTMFFSMEKKFLYGAFLTSNWASYSLFKLIVGLIATHPIYRPEELIYFFYAVALIFVTFVLINKIYALGQRPLDEDQQSWLVLFCKETKEPLPNLHYMTKEHLGYYVRKAYQHHTKESEHLAFTRHL